MAVVVFLDHSLGDEKQCDQMASLIVQYLAVNNGENSAICMKEFAKWVQNFDKHKIKPYKIYSGFINIAIVAKFRPIWSP